MEYSPLVSVIIINWNGKDIIGSCVESVLDSTYVNIEVIVVDNISIDGSIELLREKFGSDARMKIIITDVRMPTDAAINVGINNSLGEYIFFLNNYMKLEEQCIRELVSKLNEGSQVCSPKLLLPNGTIDFVGGLMDRWGYGYGRGYRQEDIHQYDNQDFFYAGISMFKKNILEKIGLFDEDIALGWGDLDFSWRVRLAGYRIVMVPQAAVYHLGSHTLKRLRSKYFCHYHMRKNRIFGLLKNYGFYNLVLSLPGLLFFYALVFFKELLLDRDARLALTCISSIWWNIKNFPRVIKKRRFIQKYVRSVSDKEVMRYMTRKAILIEYFLIPSFKFCSRDK